MDNLVTSNIRQRPIRTLVSVAGIALGVSLVMLFTGLARGMSNDLQRRATTTASIPIASSTESLNAAIAGSILLFEAIRQRRRNRTDTLNSPETLTKP